MKKISFYLTLFLLSVISFHYCKVVYGRTLVLQNQQVPEYKVNRITTLDSIYMIYARNHDGRIFKIISKREMVDSCNDIQVGCSYPFVLQSRLANPTEGPLAKYDFSLLRKSGHVTVFDFYGVGVRLEGDSIRDLFSSKNIKGLCYVR
jgi:hypothetical protein